MASKLLARRFSLAAVLRAAEKDMDPVQRVFLLKLREYREKAKKAPGKLVEATPEVESYMIAEKEKLNRLYGGGNLTEFPKFEFPN
eukprot:m.307470 g.307470  ORF g.307470 m.307470 type:complete len:86 (+) comp42322_c0_seq1:122-379(+)